MGLDKLDLRSSQSTWSASLSLDAFRKRQRSIRDYFWRAAIFPGGRSLFLSLRRDQHLTIISIPGLAYRHQFSFPASRDGICSRPRVISLYCCRIIFGDLYTAYELIERRFGADCVH